MLVLRDDGEPRFTKSSFSGSSGQCVEVCRTGLDQITVRHSTDGDRILEFSASEWTAFLTGVRAGEFDLADPEV